MTDYISIFEEFEYLIKNYIITEEINDIAKTVLKIKVNFIDDTSLNIYESESYILDKYKYGYQWMSKYDELIHRWDNTPHHPQISTFPHHQHIGDEPNVHPSEKMTLYEVMIFIQNTL
jgi:hypothetical protein